MAAANFLMARLRLRAAKLPAPQDVTLKADKDLKLIGKPVKRLDTPDKVNGKAQYGIDVRMDGLKIATLAASPVVGGKVVHVDASKLKAMPGLQLVVLDDIVGRGRPALLGRQERPGCARTYAGTAATTPRCDSAKMWREMRDTAMKAGVVAKEDGERQERFRRRRTGAWISPTNCRSCRTRRWSRRISPSM